MDYKFAVCLSSYKRFDNMQLQIYQMLHQNYDNFHVFVACKGISEYNFKRYIKPQYQKYIDDGRLTIRHFPNKNQLSNFFDTVRGLDIDGYDYFCKIDDDDLYSPNYLRTYNNFANKFPDVNFFFRKGNSRLVRRNYRGFASFEFTGYNIYMGPTLCMLKSVFNKLKEAERGELELESFLKKEGMPEDLLNCGFSEDRLFHNAMKPAINIATSIEDNVCINCSNASTMRSGFILGDFICKNKVFNKNPDYYEHILTLKESHSSSPKELRIFNKKAKYLFSNLCADVKEFSDTKLCVQWENGKTERFEKMEDGSWILA